MTYYLVNVDPEKRDEFCLWASNPDYSMRRASTAEIGANRVNVYAHLLPRRVYAGEVVSLGVFRLQIVNDDHYHDGYECILLLDGQWRRVMLNRIRARLKRLKWQISMTRYIWSKPK